MFLVGADSSNPCFFAQRSGLSTELIGTCFSNHSFLSQPASLRPCIARRAKGIEILEIKYDEEEVLKIVAENERAMEKKRNVKFIIPVNAPYVLKS